MIAGGSAILIAGLGYAAVPLYRMFCQATGYGGTVRQSTTQTVADLEAAAANVPRRRIVVVGRKMDPNF